jgi:hypothetical protein
MDQIFPAHWVPLPQDIREYLAKTFGLSRSVSTEIVDNRIVSDGYGVNDLKGITKEKMQEFLLGSKEESFARLWELTLSKANSDVHTPKEIKLKSIIAEVAAEVKKEEKKNDVFRFVTEVEKNIVDIITKKKDGTTKK